MSAALNPALRRDLGLVGWQIRYEQRLYWRNRVRGVFTFVFPLMFLVIFASINKGAHLSQLGGLPYNDFFVPGILAYGDHRDHVREHGDQHRDPARRRGPQADAGDAAAEVGDTSPPGSARPCVIVVAITVVTLALGAIAYGVDVRAATLPGLILTLVLGTAAFTTLGIGITRFISNADVAPVIVNLTVLPLTFISGVWFPTNGMPKLLNTVASIFPIKPLAHGLQYAFNPHTTSPGINATDVRSLAIWTAVGVFMMVRYLRRPQGEAQGALG